MMLVLSLICVVFGKQLSGTFSTRLDWPGDEIVTIVVEIVMVISDRATRLASMRCSSPDLRWPCVGIV